MAQCAMLACTVAPNSSGVPPPGSVPSSPSALRTLSVTNALLMASFSRPMTSAGVICPSAQLAHLNDQCDNVASALRQAIPMGSRKAKGGARNPALRT